MLKKTVTYEDYNGQMQTETLYFNITKTEMVDMLDLEPRMARFAKLDSESMTYQDTLEFFNIIKELIQLSYGERSEDGKYFQKSPEIFKNFESSAMYDSFVFGFLTNPSKALEFMVGIMPKGLDDTAIARAQSALDNYRVEQTVELPQPDLSATQSPEPVEKIDTVPAWIREDREPSKEELRDATPEELQLAFRRRFTK